VELRLGADARELEPAGGMAIAEVQDLRPEAIPAKSGVYPDNNWTNGDGVLSQFRYAVPTGHHMLTVTVGTAHPSSRDGERLGVRVLVNGLPLAFDSASGRTLRFHLYRGLKTIERLEITSSTFVPKSLGIGNDSRTLGIPVESIATAP
jgi:hypothetical protein